MPLVHVRPQSEEYNFLLINPPADTDKIEEMVATAYTDPINIYSCPSLSHASTLVDSMKYDFIILDIDVEDYTLQDACRLIESTSRYSPVLIYTTIDNPELAIQLIQSGAQDYLVKGRGTANTLRRIITYSLERARTQRELHDSQQLLSRFIKHSPAAIAMFDKDMKYLLCSDRWLEDYNLNESIIGKCHYDVFPDLPDEWKEQHVRCLNGTIIKKDIDTFHRESGKDEFIKWELVPWYTAGHIGGIIMFTEVITEKVLAQKSLEEANDKLEKAIKKRTIELEKALLIAEESNRSKTDFFTNITHELRTPLHAILNFSDFAREKYETAPPEKILGYIEKIHRSGQRLLNLVNDVLDLAKTKDISIDIQLEDVNLLEVATETIEDLKSLSEKRAITVDLKNNATATFCAADRNRLSQVIINLLSNAYKFTTEKSTVTVEISNYEHEDRFIQLAVHDQGFGIPEEELSTIFDEFSQSQKVQSGSFMQGTGLGLAICRQIVHAHGGRIWAMNNNDGGATIRFIIPKAKGSEE